jgi:hypothetical protein
LSRIEEDGRNWLRRPKLSIKSCRAIIRRRIYSVTLVQDRRRWKELVEKAKTQHREL